ncbi:hypothetical protein EK21DRAFT_79495, partial [Setomelanomma holmii]
LHMYASVNWYFKSPLRFYNNEVDMLKPLKPPRWLVKSKYETAAHHYKRVKEWEAKLPPPLEVKGSGHHMTQEYYTKDVLLLYIKWVHEAQLQELQSWYLQEDNDPSHGTKSKDNVAENLRQANWIAIIVHPGQSADLNPTEGMWLILKQRAKRQREWDGTKRDLKQIIQDVWASITTDEIRDRISQMPERCCELCENGGEKIRSANW